MTTLGFCSVCNFETVEFGDVKPYLLDRTDEFALYDKDNDGYAIMCCKCWNEQDEMDRHIFGEMKIPIKPLTWKKHLPQHHQQAPPTIIKNIVINNNTNNINYNTSNIIPTYNTTNNNTTNKITKIIDPDGIIDPLSSEYKRILKNANKYKAEREKKEAELKKQQEEFMKEEAKKKLLKEQYEMLKNYDDDKEEQLIALREREQALEDKRQQAFRDNQIKLEVAERKRLNKERMDKKDREIDAIEKAYNVSFGELSSVEQPDEILKKYNGGLLTCLICSHCNVMKAYPNGYLDTYGRLNENRTSNKDVCNECIYEKSQKEIDNRLCNMVKCKCGIKYYGATHEAKQKHEKSEKHLKALERNKRINGKIYSSIQLRKICNANLNEDRTLKIVGSSRMKKEEIIDRLLKIENLVIPEGL
jgi:hypothetical protein